MKRQEVLYVEACATRLDRRWTIVSEGEAPDFVIEEDGNRFGLEVTNVFLEDSGRGSAVRRREGDADRVMQVIRRAYEKQSRTTIDLKLPKRPQKEDIDDLLKKLLALNMDDKPVGTRATFNLRDGAVARVQRSFRPSWIVIEDSVGWVNRNGLQLLQASIDRKAKKLGDYKKNSLDDVRLLVVADRMRNSGKIEVDDQNHIRSMNFDMIYFLSYPDHALCWGSEEQELDER